MKDKQILEMLSKLKELSSNNLEKVDKTIDACIIVQALEMSKNSLSKNLMEV